MLPRRLPEAFSAEDAAAEQDLLRLFLIEKAAYEIAYEAANRPAWIDVPLHGLAQLVDRFQREGDVMNDMADLPGLPQGVAEALANGTLADPFAVLGPHDTAMGRIVRAFLPDALEVEVLARARRAVARPAGAVGAARAVRRSREQRRTVSAAHRLAGRGAGNRGSLFLRAAARRTRSASVQRRPAFRTRRASWRQRGHDRWRAPACASRSGRRMRAPSPWSAISTPGTRGAIRCGCAFRPACGSCSSRVWLPARATSLPSSGPDGWRLPLKADPLARATEAAAGNRFRRRRSDAACLARRSVDAGARAPAGTPTRRSRSTRCTPHRGSIPTGASRPGTNWPNGWCPMSARWASPISS